MIKTLTLDGLTSVTIKQSAYDMARFCWLYNHSGSDIFASCVNSECTENADNVLRIPAGEPRMIDTESYETLYLNGSGTVELITSAYSVCPFKRAAKGGDIKLQPLVLFQGTDEGYSLADGFTGFSVYYTDTLPTEEERITISQICADDSTTESRYGYLISKIKSIDNYDYNYTDSAVISSNEMVDLTNYKTLCIDFYGLASYNTTAGDEKDNISNSAYFRIDRPDTLPQSHISYDWTGWDNMGMYYRNHNKYYFDVSQISGAHYLCFGIFHGNYSKYYLNGIKIYKITLM